MKKEILLKNGYIELNITNVKKTANDNILMTIINNIISFGFIPSNSLYNQLKKCSEAELKSFWKIYLPIFKKITASDRNMEKFVVYKNFPLEVLNMSETEYWIRQLFIYLGFSHDSVSQEPSERGGLLEKMNLKVLHIAKEDSFDMIFSNLVNQKTRWTDDQKEHVIYFYSIQEEPVVISNFGFKENAVFIVNNFFDSKEFIVNNATDVLRIAASLSEGDISLRKHFKFKSFSRSDRKILLSLLDKCNNIEQDMSMRKTLWKKFMRALHPGDYKQFIKVNKAYDALYNNRCFSFNSKLEAAIKNKDENVFKILENRTGDFSRRLYQLYSVFGKKAFKEYIKIIDKVDVFTLVKLKKYFETINERKTLSYAPNGSWNKLKIIENNKKVKKKSLNKFIEALELNIKEKMEAKYNEGVNLSENLSYIKLMNNDQKLATYGRGTIFNIPENIKFIRTASYWKIPSNQSIWFDNSWNFFSKKWTPKGQCCWNSTHSKEFGAVFSGDPVNTNDLEGRACQMIDLYIDQLIEKGVRYAVWSILSYSNISFDSADEVLATLQYGEHPEEGKLYEPSRAQVVFDVKGNVKTKYIAYIDLVERKLVYMDVSLPSIISSAKENGDILKESIPAYIEYLNSLPSVLDLFKNVKEGSLPILYNDKDKPVKGKAFVFISENKESDIEKIQINELIS